MSQSSPERPVTEFGPNEWLVDELYQQYLEDKNSVDPAWWEFFADYQPADGPAGQTTSRRASEPANGDRHRPARRRHGRREPGRRAADGARPAGAAHAAPPRPTASRPPPRRRDPPSPRSPRRRPGPAQPAAAGRSRRSSPRSSRAQPSAPRPLPRDAAVPTTQPKVTPRDAEVVRLKGPAGRVVTNMEASLEVPTATSVRAIPAKLLIDNRIVINNHLARARGGKVSFTHLIGFALVEALDGDAGDERQLHRGRRQARASCRPAHVNLGIAIDLAEAGRHPPAARAERSSTARRMDFAEFWAAYEDVVRRARDGKLGADDFAGHHDLSLTNPGTIGTVHSVPRLMQGQGTIIGVGAMEYPAEYQGASEETLARLARQQGHDADLDVRPPDHPGRAVRRLPAHRRTRSCSARTASTTASSARCAIPYEPVRWVRDISVSHDDEVTKPARVAGADPRLPGRAAT